MAFELSRVDRLTKTYDLAARFPDLDGPFTAADIALLPPRAAPNGATVWEAAGVTAGIATVTFAGPDADSSGAVVVNGSADLWIRVTVDSDVDAAKIERITLLGGGTILAPGPLPQVLSVQGRTGAIVLDADDVGAATPADLSDGLATKVNSSTYVTGLAGKQDAATLVADTAAHVTDGSALDVALRAALVPPALSPRIPRPRTAQLVSLSQFQASNGWSISVGSWNLNDTTRPIIGTQHASVTTSTKGTVAAIDKTISSTDLSNKMLAILVWVDDITKLDYLQIYAGDSTLANSVNWSPVDGSLSEWTSTIRSGSWQWVYCSGATASVAGTGSQSAVTRLRIRAIPNTEGVPVTVSIQEVAYFTKPTAYPNGVVTFSFDDTEGTQTRAELPLSNYGYKGTMFTIVDRVGASGMLSMADLVRQHDTLGWEIAGHAYTTANHDTKYANLADDVVDLEMRQLKTWLLTNGFRGADHFAWPGGQDSDSTAAIARKYWTTGRGLCVTGGVRKQLMSVECGDMPLRMRAQTPDSSTAPAVTTAMIDSAYSSGSWLILGYHQLVDTIGAASSVKYLYNDFKTVVDYCSTKGIAVATVSEVLRAAQVV